MRTQIPVGPNSAMLTSVPELIEEFENTTSAHRLEATAELLGASRDQRAISALFTRLGDPIVQGNARAEKAVCAALAALGVMRRSTSGRYMLLPRHLLDLSAAGAVAKIAPTLPLRYFYLHK